MTSAPSSSSPLLAPARPAAPAQVVRRWSEALSEEPAESDRARMRELASSAKSVTERLQQALHPLTSFVIVPVFALANAGVTFEREVLAARGATAVAGGVALGLVVGKIVGISGFSFLAVRLKLGSLPSDVRWSELVGVGAVAGVGFTVSLFVAGLAFEPGAGLQPAAKVGILAASATAAVVGSSILTLLHRREALPA